jgi:tetratricopeptide (TPR) repeat protein
VKLDLERAIADFTEAIRIEPKDADLYSMRGDAHAMRQDHAKAIADFTTALRLSPNNATTYYSRGRAYALSKDHENAVKDFTECLRLKPGDADFYYNRGTVYAAKKDFVRAIADYREAIRLAPRQTYYYFALAWVLATCSKAEMRDGKQALAYARRGCEMAGWTAASGGFSALAAAYAEVGDFKEAVKWQRKALASPDDFPKQVVEKMQGWLKLYEQGKPCRE